MRCPRDTTALVRAERSGVEVDYCPDCRGVWLDRGELDKIIQNDSGRQYDEYESPIQPHRQYRDHDHDRSSSVHGRKKTRIIFRRSF